ncbi:hypothetical protein C7451_11845 [Blastomonas natatoria]|uniref:Uncharacterized protein n=1 Tax=Blastomonas natatoria TaxID=34015 RepID=A0A2V3UPJ8_9SPHN|nr:hypothetical protein C7451_11845 [Blastomonas natatoria]
MPRFVKGLRALPQIAMQAHGGQKIVSGIPHPDSDVSGRLLGSSIDTLARSRCRQAYPAFAPVGVSDRALKAELLEVGSGLGADATHADGLASDPASANGPAARFQMNFYALCLLDRGLYHADVPLGCTSLTRWPSQGPDRALRTRFFCKPAIYGFQQLNTSSSVIQACEKSLPPQRQGSSFWQAKNAGGATLSAASFPLRPERLPWPWPGNRPARQ